MKALLKMRKCWKVCGFQWTWLRIFRWYSIINFGTKKQIIICAISIIINLVFPTLLHSKGLFTKVFKLHKTTLNGFRYFCNIFWWITFYYFCLLTALATLPTNSINLTLIGSYRNNKLTELSWLITYLYFIQIYFYC